jgi:hypothetical protein
MSSDRVMYQTFCKYLYGVVLLTAAVVVLVRGERFTDNDGPHVLPTLMCILFGITAAITSLVMMMSQEGQHN